MITKIEDFLALVRAGGDAYTLFEDECSPQLRSMIYGLSEHKDSPEPFRASMDMLGFSV